VGIRCADHATSSIRKKLTLTSPTSGGRSVGIVRLRTKSHGVCLFGSVSKMVSSFHTFQTTIYYVDNNYYTDVGRAHLILLDLIRLSDVTDAPGN
jgi:hypothetical protein